MSAAVQFDRWRAEYPTKTLEEHAALYDKAFLEGKGHASFSGRAVRAFFRQAGSPAFSVAEVGGMNGALAKVALEFTPAITRWINYEISPAAAGNPLSKDPRYICRLMVGDFRWWEKESVDGDLLILSHVIEHLADDDLRSFVGHIPQSVRAVHVQAPIPLYGPTNWNGFVGAHILSMGWFEVDHLFSGAGFRNVHAYDGASWVRR